MVIVKSPWFTTNIVVDVLSEVLEGDDEDSSRPLRVRAVEAIASQCGHFCYVDGVLIDGPLVAADDVVRVLTEFYRCAGGRRREQGAV